MEDDWDGIAEWYAELALLKALPVNAIGLDVGANPSGAVYRIDDGSSLHTVPDDSVDGVTAALP